VGLQRGAVLVDAVEQIVDTVLGYTPGKLPDPRE